jgi:ABC-type glycerol-3-phosphate transport system substrate-binding protein
LVRYTVDPPTETLLAIASSLTPALNEKIVSALTTGHVPDLMYADNAPAQIIPQSVWDGKLADVTDVVETQKSELSATALQSAQFYNNVEKKRSFYGVPFKGATLNIPTWKSLIEKAGYKVSDIPKTWDPFYAFFEDVQKKLRAQGMRHTYGLGYTISTTGDDPNNTFVQFLVAHGGGGIVTPDGKLHVDDPKVADAMAKTLTQLASAFKEGYVPPDALNWGDPDNNNAFHSQEVVMTPNDTVSISKRHRRPRRSSIGGRASRTARSIWRHCTPGWWRNTAMTVACGRCSGFGRSIIRRRRSGRGAVLRRHRASRHRRIGRTFHRW